jgi:hypothetical protein
MPLHDAPPPPAQMPDEYFLIEMRSGAAHACCFSNGSEGGLEATASTLFPD